MLTRLRGLYLMTTALLPFAAAGALIWGFAALWGAIAEEAGAEFARIEADARALAEQASGAAGAVATALGEVRDESAKIQKTIADVGEAIGALSISVPEMRVLSSLNPRCLDPFKKAREKPGWCTTNVLAPVGDALTRALRETLAPVTAPFRTIGDSVVRAQAAVAALAPLGAAFEAQRAALIARAEAADAARRRLAARIEPILRWIGIGGAVGLATLIGAFALRIAERFLRGLRMATTAAAGR